METNNIRYSSIQLQSEGVCSLSWMQDVYKEDFVETASFSQTHQIDENMQKEGPSPSTPLTIADGFVISQNLNEKHSTNEFNEILMVEEQSPGAISNDFSEVEDIIELPRKTKRKLTQNLKKKKNYQLLKLLTLVL
jgi:hypothetical protein